MSWKQHIKYLGPGLVVAATGVGAGDLIAASVGGANFGYIILWSALVGALIKYTLNEGVARWQLESQLSIIEAWRKYFPSWISTFFLIYLMIWSFIVGAALSSACGLAAHAIFPILSIPVWGIIQAVIALILVVFIQYSLFEKVMKILIAVMFSLVIFSTFLSQPDWWKVLKGVFIPGVPAGSIWLILGIIGGVGGSVSILSYGYWIKEKNWKEKKHLSRVKVDLTVAYILTALFALAIMIMAAELHPDNLNGSKIVLSLAEKIGKTTGKTGEWIFLL
ncbi:MAG: hypothetical protein GQ527_07065, partial [Bacteroidales bacterium]|nr:hypothetical protein [Bacteroidales bacterium]